MELPDNDDVSPDHDVDVLTSAETLLRDEFGQAWQHYRHLETMRSQYLAFSFTITLASLAVAIPLLAHSTRTISSLLLIGVFVQLYCLIVGSLYFNVRKIRIVLSHYRKTIQSVRCYFYDRAQDFTYDTGRLNITRRTYAIAGWRPLRIQATSESILLTFLLIGGLAESICTISAFTLSLMWWETTLVVLLFAGAMTVVASVSTFAWIHRNDEYTSRARQ